MKKWVWGVSLVVSAGLALGSHGQDAELAAGVHVIVAYSPAAGLVASTGNLYWTANDVEAGSASVWRASKDNTPGSEGLLYQEASTSASVLFGDIVYANVSGTWYGYFVAKYQYSNGAHASFIKRVPLAGGGATVVATSPVYPANSLATDGTNLFWSDGGGIRRLPLAGGAMVTLVSSTAAGKIALDAGSVYYAQGTLVRRVPKTGGPVTTVASAYTGVSDLYAHVAGATTTLYFCDQTAAVLSRRVGSSTTTTHQPPTAGRRATSVGFDGFRVLWVDCTASSSSSCTVKKRELPWGVITMASGGVGARELQWDATRVFWTEAATIEKYTH